MLDKADMTLLERVAWQKYFRAALSGYLASGTLDPRTAGVPKVVAEACGQVADAAIAEQRQRDMTG